MSRTYRAVLHSDQVQWLGKPPPHTDPVPVQITLVEEAPLEPAHEPGRAMAEALALLADRGTFASITDPVAWQREVRHERALPDRGR